MNVIYFKINYLRPKTINPKSKLIFSRSKIIYPRSQLTYSVIDPRSKMGPQFYPIH